MYDFARHYTLHQAGAFFVTRAKSPMDARRVFFLLRRRALAKAARVRTVRRLPTAA